MKKCMALFLCMAVMTALAVPVRAQESHTLTQKAQQIGDTITGTCNVTSIQYAIIDQGDISLSGSSEVFDNIGSRAVTGDTNRYFAIGPEAEGKTLVIDLPESAAYAVYDENAIRLE